MYRLNILWTTRAIATAIVVHRYWKVSRNLKSVKARLKRNFSICKLRYKLLSKLLHLLAVLNHLLVGKGRNA